MRRMIVAGVWAAACVACMGETDPVIGERSSSPPGSQQQAAPPGPAEPSAPPQTPAQTGGGTETKAPVEAPPPAAPPPAGTLAVTVGDAAPVVRLNETKELAAMVTPSAGFSGTV